MPATPLTNPTVVGQTNAGAQFAPAIAALSGSTYVITWLDDARGGIYAQRYDASGAAIGTEFRVDTPGSNLLFPSVAALSDGGFVIAWQSGVFNSADIHARRFDSTGAPVGNEFTVNTNLANEQLDVRVIGLSNGGFLFTWDTIAGDKYQDISGRLYNSAGNPLGPEFLLNTTTADSQGIPSVAPTAGGGFVATWQSVFPAGAAHAVLFGQRFAPDGSKLGAEFQVNTNTTNSPTGDDIATLSDGSFVITWIDPVPSNGGGRIVARHYDAGGNALSGEITIFSTASASFGNTAVTALVNGGYLVAWTNRNAPTNQMSAQAMGANDQPVDGAFNISPGSQFESVLYADGAVTLANGHVVFAWDGPSTNTGEDVYMRVYDLSGASTPPGEGTAGPDTLDGTPGDDTLKGLGGDDVLNGLGGNDILIGGTGVDRMTGGTGDDYYFVDNAADLVIETGGEGTDRVFAGASYVLAAGVDVELMTTDWNIGTDPIALTGNELANTLIGNAGANILDGKAGADRLAGLGGDDYYYVDNIGDVVTEAAGQGNDRVFASISYTLGAGVSVETLSTDFNAGTGPLNLGGNELANTLIGNDGANLLDGRAGADTLSGLGGDDLYFVDNAGDLVLEAAGQGSDRIFASLGFTLGAGQEVELLTTDWNIGTDAIALTGNEFANTLVGNDGANVLDGKGGSDVLIGRAGADSFAFTTALGAGNVDRLVDFATGSDKLQLDHAVFAQIGGPGPLAAGAFVTGSAAGDADERIVYNNATGQLFYDADGNGAGGAILFATLAGAPALSAADIQVI